MANMTNRDPSRSALMSAGQSSLLSPRPDLPRSKVINAQPVYATSYPFPGASTLVKNTFPDTSQPSTTALQDTIAQGNTFRQISPRTRADRRTVESKDELARQRCIQRNDGYHRLPHQSNYNYHNPFDLGENQPTTWVEGTVERYTQDHKRLQTVNYRALRREKIMTDEAQRWQKFDAAATKDRQRWDDIRAESLKAKANLSSLPYDPVTLRTKDSIDGLQYEYEEGLMKYREQLRSKNLYGKYNANGFNPVNGQPLYMGSMPQRPPNVQELAQQKDSLRNADAIQLVKSKIIERGGMNGIRTAARIFRSLDQTGNNVISKEELISGFTMMGIDGLSIDQIDDIIRAIDLLGDGSIRISELIRQLRGSVSERRVALIQQAWATLDKNGKNAISMTEMMSVYDVNSRPEVVQGRMTAEQAMQDFLQVWGKAGDATVTWEEFAEYYMDVSGTIEKDDIFEMMIRNSWQLTGDQEQFSNTARRVLLIHKSGQMTVCEVPGGVLPNNMPPAALMNEIKRRFRDAGVQFLDIKLN
jgi:Ca2+-binding EF-hand superfamily protein